MGSARGRNKYRRKRRASAKRVRAVWICAENGRVSIEPKLQAPLESVRSVNVSHVVLQLIDVAVRSEKRSVRRIERLKKSVAKRERHIGVICGGENRCAAHEAEGSHKAEVWCDRARVAQRRAALMVEEIYAECRVNRRLVRICRRPAHLVEAESAEKIRLVRNPVIHAN